MRFLGSKVQVMNSVVLPSKNLERREICKDDSEGNAREAGGKIKDTVSWKPSEENGSRRNGPSTASNATNKLSKMRTDH